MTNRTASGQTPGQLVGNILIGLVSGLLLQWLAGPRVIAPEQYEQLLELGRQDPVLVLELRETLHERIPTEADYQRLLRGHVLRRRAQDAVSPPASNRPGGTDVGAEAH